MRVAVLPLLGAALLASSAAGCVSRATAGSLMRETGNVFAARGVLEAANVLGHGCTEDQGSTQRNVTLCGTGGGSSAGANMASLGVGTARVAMGLALVAIADATSPSARPRSNLDLRLDIEQALAAAPNALDRYEDARVRSARQQPQWLGCFDRQACPHVVSELAPLDEHAASTSAKRETW